MLSRLAALVLILCLSNVPAALAAQATYAITTKDAPLFVVKDDRGVPLRVAKADSRLKVLKDEGDWVLVEFEDPQWGRRQGYMQRRCDPGRSRGTGRRLGARGAGESHRRRRRPGGTARARAADAPACRPVSKWSGIGLLIGGGATVGVGAAIQDGDCYDFDYSCDELRQGFYIFGAILAGTGATLLAIGAAKSGGPRTSIQMTHGRLLLQHRIAF